MNSEQTGSTAGEVEDSIEGMASPRFPWDNIHDDKRKKLTLLPYPYPTIYANNGPEKGKRGR